MVAPAGRPHWRHPIPAKRKTNRLGSKTLVLVFVFASIGWRTLKHYRRTPLPWLADIDEDGRVELLLWDSFVLDDWSTMGSYGLVVWVYRFDGNDVFAIDWALTRQMAAELSQAYLRPMEGEAAYFSRLRKAASDRLRLLSRGNRGAAARTVP